MSLKLKLALILTILLIGVVLLWSFTMYSMVSVQLMRGVEKNLSTNLQEIIKGLRADTLGELELVEESVTVFPDVSYQVWDNNKQIIAYSENVSDLTYSLDNRNLFGQDSRFSSVEIEGESTRVLTMPINTEYGQVGWVQVGVGLAAQQASLKELLLIITLGDVVAGLLVAGLSWLILKRGLLPLQVITEATEKITSSDDLSLRVNSGAPPNDEVGQLALAINQTRARLDMIFKSQQRFMADISHELRTPLTVIKGNLGLIKLMKKADQESLTSMEKEIDRLTRLVGELLFITQAETGNMTLHRSPLEFDDLFVEVIKQLQVLDNGMHSIELVEIDQSIVLGDRDRLEQVLLNLGCNAIKYTPNGGKIRLGMKNINHELCFWVSDTGQGIPEKELPQLFKRHFRGSANKKLSYNEGSFGLGLSIVDWIIKQHEGSIEVESAPDQGTTFYVCLPLID